LLHDLIDLSQRTANVVLDGTEYRIENAEELPVGILRHDYARLDQENAGDNSPSPVPPTPRIAFVLGPISLTVQKQYLLILRHVFHRLIASCISFESSTGKGASSASPLGYCAASSSYAWIGGSD
jgi:hypothetical protein